MDALEMPASSTPAAMRGIVANYLHVMIGYSDRGRCFATFRSHINAVIRSQRFLDVYCLSWCLHFWSFCFWCG